MVVCMCPAYVVAVAGVWLAQSTPGSRLTLPRVDVPSSRGSASIQTRISQVICAAKDYYILTTTVLPFVYTILSPFELSLVDSPRAVAGLHGYKLLFLNDIAKI